MNRPRPAYCPYCGGVLVPQAKPCEFPAIEGMDITALWMGTCESCGATLTLAFERGGRVYRSNLEETPGQQPRRLGLE